MSRTPLFALIAAGLLAGCAARPLWEPMKSDVQPTLDESFSVIAPAGWMRYNPRGVRNAVLLTRDGPELQVVECKRIKLKDAYRALKKSVDPKLLPSEQMDLYIAEVRAQHKDTEIKVLDSGPADLGGHQGFRVHYQLRNEQGLRIGFEVYGMTTQDGLFLLSFRAPVLYYFDRDRPAFRAVVESFKLHA